MFTLQILIFLIWGYLVQCSPVLLLSNQNLNSDETIQIKILKEYFKTSDLVKWSRKENFKIKDYVDYKFFPSHCNIEYSFNTSGNIFNININNVSDSSLNLLIKSGNIFLIDDTDDSFVIIENLLSKIFEKVRNVNFLIILGGKNNDLAEQQDLFCPYSDLDSSLLIHNRVERAEPATSVQRKKAKLDYTQGLFINGSCLYMYIYNASLHVIQHKKPPLVETIPLRNMNYILAEAPDCNDKTLQHLTIEFTQLPQGVEKLNWRLSFGKNTRNYWRLVNSSVDFAVRSKSNIDADNAILYIPDEVGAHVNHSYVCAQLKLREKDIRIERNYIVMDIARVQIQAFGIHNESFAKRVNDCTGFFSPALWMGIFVGLVMLSILAFGLSVFLSTKTSDNFENVKGMGPLNLGGGVAD